MSTFRYDTSGTWYKGNTHVHTVASDGGKSAKELAAMYAGAGYDFLFRTDHFVASNVAMDESSGHLLWLDGIELDGNDEVGSGYHVVCLGRFEGMEKDMGFLAAMESTRAQGGLLILAHPHWLGNTIDDALRHDFDGVEVYNHVCGWINGKSDGAVYWDAMLERWLGVLGFAADDAHISANHPGWNGGWIMVNAEACSSDAILSAIRAGNFYSSCGPTIHSIDSDGGTVSIRTSPVRFIRLVGPTFRGERAGSYDGEPVTEARFAIKPDWAYIRIEVEDQNGKRAWTNPLFLAE